MARANGKPLKLEGEGYDLLHSEFERHARENPSHVALEFLDNDCKITSWTFRELNEAANRVAHYLVSLGLKRDEAVPLCLEKSPLFYICILGVLKAGCAFTPIDPTLPDQRKMFMVEELGARVVLVTAATAGGMGRVAMVDVESGVMDSQPVTNLNISGLTPRCLAYRLYTSGKSVYINDFKRIFVDYLHQAPLVSPKLSLLKSRALCKLSAPQSPSSHGNRIQGSSNSLQLPLICATTTVSWRGVMGLHFVLQRRNISLVTSKELS